ncbi:hypothetical protein D9758_008314 [Tetrapyrgos nigripes]|uniref:Uncharacterized protein n=1 Tax=Tetrapyrgos nigripes TaxID=182062 RepID=A0A8H5GDZ2_9AGAR|nr:hypothetical protein D9758_016867 [Tetrapyrgos nigripes]KAF5363197.1 hypothetical protein D9758_008314 [Tetrapyrgos nigripes]
MVFYAYISETRDDNVWRIVLAFTDSSTADEWWRAIADSENSLLADVRRVTPEMYIHNTAVFNMNRFFVETRITNISQNFKGRLILTLQSDRGGRGIDIFPKQGVTDLISGNWFYIRSTVDPEMYWDYKTKEGYPHVTVSRTGRSLFCVTATNTPTRTVMIRSDTVQLSTWGVGKVVINSEGLLLTTGTAQWSFTFGNLASGRFVDTDAGLVFSNIDNDGPKRPGWELVN